MRMIQKQLDPDNPVFGKNKSTKRPDQPEAKVQQIVDEINKAHPEPREQKIDVGTAKNRVTVWFNAWKYESTNQIWAGLADTIVKQVAERLSPIERELFFFRLHLKRIDVGKIRNKIFNGALSKLTEIVYQWWWLYLVLPFAAHLLKNLTAIQPYVPSIVGAVPYLGVWLDLALLVSHAILAHKENLAKPAKIEFGEWVSAPDYNTNLGFIHQVTEDLMHTLELVAPTSRPLVIFIDDLDRCSPSKVSEVIEAINLFLAGEFEGCMFVLGIDDEVVAAALNKSHSDVFAQMPAYARATSIGWRFMDKFVQLPFIMPPPTPKEIGEYAQSLLVTREQKSKLPLEARQEVAAAVEQSPSGKPVEAIVAEVEKKLNLDTVQKADLRKEANTIVKMDADIRQFSDDEKGIAQILEQGLQKFSRNPRDVKRFVNSFRFYYFLRSALLAREGDAPTISQLSRWIFLSLSWPGIVRWLRGRQLDPEDETSNGLIDLESLLDESNQTSWTDGAAKLIGLDPKDLGWISDPELCGFFRDERLLPANERLSSSLGMGLW